MNLTTDRAWGFALQATTRQERHGMAHANSERIDPQAERPGTLSPRSSESGDGPVAA